MPACSKKKFHSDFIAIPSSNGSKRVEKRWRVPERTELSFLRNTAKSILTSWNKSPCFNGLSDFFWVPFTRGLSLVLTFGSQAVLPPRWSEAGTIWSKLAKAIPSARTPSMTGCHANKNDQICMTMGKSTALKLFNWLDHLRENTNN